MRNKYFLIVPNSKPLEIFDENFLPNSNISEYFISEYFLDAFQIIEHNYNFREFTVFLVWSPKTQLPRVGTDVIAVVYGEPCIVPSYAGLVSAVFKCYGLHPTFIPRRNPLRLAQIEVFEFIRNLAYWMPTGIKWMMYRNVRQTCHAMPLGYARHGGVDGLPFDQRPYLVSFSGGVAKPASRQWLRRIIGTPKYYCRHRLVEILRNLQRSLGEKVIHLSVGGGFHQNLASGGGDYFDVLARTKICVAPRGTAHETYRIAEGIRLGCVVISDRLPKHSFYENSPVIQIDDWATLPAILDRLLNDPEELRNLHQRSLEFWNNKLSENAFAERFATILGLRWQISSDLSRS